MSFHLVFTEEFFVDWRHNLGKLYFCWNNYFCIYHLISFVAQNSNIVFTELSWSVELCYLFELTTTFHLCQFVFIPHALYWNDPKHTFIVTKHGNSQCLSIETCWEEILFQIRFEVYYINLRMLELISLEFLLSIFRMLFFLTQWWSK